MIKIYLDFQSTRLNRSALFMLPGDGSVKCLSTSGFNKSVTTFDGLISACVWFLKMAREGRGKGEGKGGGVKHPPSRRPGRQSIGRPLLVDLDTLQRLLSFPPATPTPTPTPLACYPGQLCRLSHHTGLIRTFQPRCCRWPSSPYLRERVLPAGTQFPLCDPLRFL